MWRTVPYMEGANDRLYCTIRHSQMLMLVQVLGPRPDHERLQVATRGCCVMKETPAVCATAIYEIRTL